MAVLFILIIAIYAALVAVPSYFIYIAVHNKLAQAGNPQAKVFGIASFIVSYILIFISVALLILSNIRLER